MPVFITISPAPAIGPELMLSESVDQFGVLVLLHLHHAEHCPHWASSFVFSFTCRADHSSLFAIVRT